MTKQSATIITFNKTRTWQQYAKAITEAWQKSVDGIIEAGRLLIEAKADPELKHGEFEAMVNLKLPFTPSTARMLMIIARNSELAKREHVHVLPPSWGTLYELTKLPPETLRTCIEDGRITPKLERKDVRTMNPNIMSKPKAASRDKLIAAIQKEPNANQRDAAKVLNVSLGVYQRTRNELIGSGEIKGALSLDDLRERIVSLLRDLPKEQRMREIERHMKALDLNIHDWVSTMTIGKRGK